MSSEIDVRLLGPLEVEHAGARVRLDGIKQRRLFVLLALRAPEAVSQRRAARGPVGGGRRPPARCRHCRSRSRVCASTWVKDRPCAIGRRATPWRSTRRRSTPAGSRISDRARVELGRNEPERAAADLREALALWRGEALADHRFDEFAQHEIARLEELRVEAIEERLAAELAESRDADLVGELGAGRRAPAARAPARAADAGAVPSRPAGGGARDDALGRRLLVDELGIEPGPELRRLERMILAHDPELSAVRPALGSRPLPAPANETIGRGGELAEIGELLVRPGVRLVTLVGPGGVGKTRLALEAARAVADRFPGGAVHVNLDGVEDAGVLVPEAASALGVVAATAAELGEQLGRTTRGAPALLVLDGFERFLEDAGQIGQLLAAVANLTVLATSRAPLRLTAEHAYRVQPLAAPSAAALFVARAGAVRAGPGDRRRAADRRCDLRASGRPAAGDRAGGRPRPVAAAAGAAGAPRPPARAADRRPARPAHAPAVAARDPRMVLETLERPERELLGRLTVFEGGASLDAAEAVCDGEPGGGLEALVSSLLDKSSLLRTDSGRDTQPRFGMLDTVREFAAERAAERRGPRRSSSGTHTTSWAIASTPRSRRRARIGANGSTGSRRSAATSAWRSSGCCAPARPTRRCAWRSRSPRAALGRPRP